MSIRPFCVVLPLLTGGLLCLASGARASTVYEGGLVDTEVLIDPAANLQLPCCGYTTFFTWKGTHHLACRYSGCLILLEVQATVNGGENGDCIHNWSVSAIFHNKRAAEEVRGQGLLTPSISNLAAIVPTGNIYGQLQIHNLATGDTKCALILQDYHVTVSVYGCGYADCGPVNAAVKPMRDLKQEREQQSTDSR